MSRIQNSIPRPIVVSPVVVFLTTSRNIPKLFRSGQGRGPLHSDSFFSNQPISGRYTLSSINEFTSDLDIMSTVPYLWIILTLEKTAPLKKITFHKPMSLSTGRNFFGVKFPLCNQ